THRPTPITGPILTPASQRSHAQDQAGNPPSRIAPPIPQERPPPAHLLDAVEIDLCDHDRLAIGRGFHNHRPERIRQERRAPELDALPIPAVARSFLPYAVDRGDITSVGDRVAALDRAPAVELPA